MRRHVRRAEGYRSARSRPAVWAVPVLLMALCAAAAASDAQRQAHAIRERGQVRLFPPEELGLLEGPDREAWQMPDQVMDALGLAEGSRVADLGAGGGWFTLRLARRVGPNGIVYAEDIQPQMIDSIKRRMDREGLRNVTLKLGTANDPKLPVGALDAALMVDIYHEVVQKVELLRNVKQALTPTGRLGIVNYKTDGGGPGPDIRRVVPQAVINDARAAGLHLLAHETFLPYQYLLIFGKGEHGAFGERALPRGGR
ncbi:MAG: methyltransferase domain-containing protein [Luteitalea sp.]|nr:methyltransferase domain-containing protein [Luteitalea sp.]